MQNTLWPVANVFIAVWLTECLWLCWSLGPVMVDVLLASLSLDGDDVE